MIKKVSSIILFFLITACNYQPIYSNKNILDYEIKEISFLGDKKINNQIVSYLNVKENGSFGKTFLLESKKNKKVASKDSSGNALMYEMLIELNLNILDKNGNGETSKVFFANFTYPNKDNKFDLSEYEKNLEINLVQSISEQVRVFLSIQK